MRKIIILQFALWALLLPSAYADSDGRVLEVDRMGSTPYKTIAEAVEKVLPGDTIRLKPNSGPYREAVSIRKSGTAEKPIIFDGCNNLVTSFDVIKNWKEDGGKISCRIGRWPVVITYKGERLLQDYKTKKFIGPASYDPRAKNLTLRAGAEKNGWEYSKRWVTFDIKNVSHHIYRNVRASGAYNDGFNIHGKCNNLVFENIEGFHNIDEGFSSHDASFCTIRGGKFWGNDNGIANSASELKEPLSEVTTVLENVECYDNLGRGIVLHDCRAEMTKVKCWNNGVVQLYFYNAKISLKDVFAYTPPYKQQPYVSYKDTRAAEKSGLAYETSNSEVTGEPVVENK